MNMIVYSLQQCADATNVDGANENNESSGIIITPQWQLPGSC